jgi:transcriptional regulator with XRE-family HTH domain
MPKSPAAVRINVQSDIQPAVGKLKLLSNKRVVVISTCCLYNPKCSYSKFLEDTDMSAIKIHEQIAFLRKRENMTQEELAQVLGVTNQTVSKWESGACCPDITLLPEIAAYFKVSVDELLGYKAPDSVNAVCLKLKELFQATPEKDCFDLAVLLGFVLHEGAATKGYKGYVPWDTTKERKLEDVYKWGFSACSEPEGSTLLKGSSVFISSSRQVKPVSSSEIRNIHSMLSSFADMNVLRVLFSLHRLTYLNDDTYVSPDVIMDECHLSKDAVIKALDQLTVQIKTQDDGTDCYRIDGPAMHLPALLGLFTL